MDHTDLKVGAVINFRGEPATVIDCWTRPEDSPNFGYKLPPLPDAKQKDPPRRMTYQAGAVIEWQDDKGILQRCRLLWWYPPIRDENDNMTGKVGGAIECEGLNGELLTLWGE